MDTPESPVRHDKHLIAGLRFGDDHPDKPLQIALDARAIAERRKRSCGIPTEIRAKSSQTATPAAVPRSSMRRRTPLKRASVWMARFGSTPAACAAAMAASAF